MRNPENIKELLEVGVDFIGFIFYGKSTRFVDDDSLVKIAEVFDNQQDVKKIGVFVNADLETILSKNEVLKLEVIQLHGQESPEFCEAVCNQGFQVIKVFPVGSNFDFNQLKAYESVCDYFLFDTKGKLPGGNGFQFDWSILSGYDGTLPFFIGGGIDTNSIHKIKGFKHPKLFAIDGNSGFEKSPGQKDIQKIQEFKNQLTT